MPPSPFERIFATNRPSPIHSFNISLTTIFCGNYQKQPFLAGPFVFPGG